MPLTESLEKLVDTWESKGVPMRLRLRPGLTRAEVQAELNPLGLTPPEELYELYEWHDGIEDWDSSGEMLFCERQFLPLKDAIKEYHEFRQYYNQEDTKVDLDKCFPFAFFMGDICTIYCDPTPVLSLQYPVIGIYYGIYVAFENIDKMAQTAAEWLVAGVYSDDRPADEGLFFSIRDGFNPRIPDEAGL